MKIAFIIATLQNGGAERVLVSLANEFCKNCEVKIIKFDNLPSFYELDKGVLVEDLPTFKFTNLYHKIASRFKKFFALRRALKTSKADIFISFLDSTNIACIMANFGLKTPLIISEHSTQGYLKPKIWRLLRRLFYPYCDALTVLSSKDRAYYESFVKNVKLLLNPCHFTPCLNLKKENVVLFVGRLDKNKNCAMFLRAVANLPPSLQKEYEFIIAGEGEERKNLEKLALNLKINVNFLGRVKNIEALYKRAKIICLCSFVEGLPTVLIESMFFEVARISTDYENSARDLIEEGKDGFLVPCDEARAMSEKLTLLMQDEALRLSLVKNATKRCEDFSIETVVKQWFELINELLERKQDETKFKLNSKPNLTKSSQDLKENLAKPEFKANSKDKNSSLNSNPTNNSILNSINLNLTKQPSLNSSLMQNSILNLNSAKNDKAKFPFLSVLITTYNRKDLLQKAVKSVLNQDFEDLEIIISDDNSTDGTAELCKNLCEKNSKIHYTKNTHYKKGPNGNKNNALDNAKGEFVMFLDDDDELLENAINILVKESKNGYSHIFANCLIKKDGQITEEFSGQGLNSSCEVNKKDFLLGKFYGEFLSIFKKSLLGKNRFDDELWGHEALLWVHLYKEKSLYLHKALRAYTKDSEGSVTNSALQNAKGVYLGYLALARLLEAEFIATKDKDYKKQIALHYKMAAYYAKFAKMPKKMLKCLAKSLSTKPTKEALMLLCVCFVPCFVLEKLTVLRVRLCKN